MINSNDVPEDIKDDYGRGISTLKLAKLLDIKRNQTLSDFLYKDGNIGMKVADKLMKYLNLKIYKY